MAVTYAACLVLVLHAFADNGAQSAASLVQDAPSQCQSLRPPINGLIQCSQNLTQLVCTATCNTGYKFDSGLKSETRVCDDTTGSWINGDLLPFCVPSNTTAGCSGQNINQYTVTRCTGNADKLLCTLYCSSGYIFDTGDSVVSKFCDLTTQTWVGGDSFPQCVNASPTTACNNTLLSNINDTKFTASSEWKGVKGYYFGPERARLGAVASNNGTLVNSGGWRPAANTLDQYIQVQLNEVTRITGIITKGRNVVSGDTANEFVSKFRVLHSLDGKAWEPYSSVNVSDQFLDGNTDRDSSVTNLFSCPFDALYVRVNPLVWHENIALRFELLGCPPSSGPKRCSDLQTTTTTTETPTTTLIPTTTRPVHLCYSVPPPTHGVVNCEESGDQLVCVANCQQGYRFVSNEVLVKRVCLQQSGAWPVGQGFPACVANVQPTSVPPVHNYTNECLDVQKKCDKITNGDYQACSACHFFATCSEGYLYVRACPEQLVFDAIKQQCDYHSRTCPGQNPQPVG